MPSSLQEYDLAIDIVTFCEEPAISLEHLKDLLCAYLMWINVSFDTSIFLCRPILPRRQHYCLAGGQDHHYTLKNNVAQQLFTKPSPAPATCRLCEYQYCLLGNIALQSIVVGLAAC